MNDVFISYSRRDKVFVQKLYECLTAANRTVWADWDSIPAASDWFAEIKQGIQETDSVLFVLSPEWIKSNECRKELVYAVEMGKRLFPILYLPVDPKDVPPELAKINWVYMRDSDDFDRGFQTLCSAMDTDLDWIKTHTRIQVRALEWDRKKRDHSFVLRGNDLTEGEQFISGATGKSPEPTHLQGEYILASRKDATRRQRQTLAGVTVALIVSIALGITAFIQRQAATRAEATAVVERDNAVVAQNTAVSAQATAVANEKEAKRQAQIALARQLASQAQLINTNKSSNQLTASLLSIQSMKLYPSSDAASFLLNNNLAAQPVLVMDQGVAVDRIIFSSDGKFLVSKACERNATGICDPSSVSIRDSRSGKEVHRFNNEQGAIESVVLSPDGKYLIYWACAETSQDANCLRSHIKVTETFTGNDVFQINSGNYNNVLAFSWQDQSHHAFAISQGGKYIATPECNEEGVCKKDSIQVWEVATGKSVLSVKGDSTIFAFALSSDSKYLVSADCSHNNSSSGTCSQHFVHVWDISTGNKVQQVPFDVPVLNIAFSPDGKYLGIGGSELTEVLDTATWKTLFDSKKGFGEIVFSENNKYVMSAADVGSGSDLKPVWELTTGKLVSEVHDGRSFSPDSKYIVTTFRCCGGGNMWETETGNQAFPLNLDGYLSSGAFSPDGKYFVGGSDDGTARAWDFSTGKEVARMTHNGAVSSVAFSPDGKHVASGSVDGTVRLWKIQSNKEVLHIPYTTGYSDVPHVTIGKNIIGPKCSKFDAYGYCRTANTISTWEIPSGKEVKSVTLNTASGAYMPKDYSRIAYFSPDGIYVVSIDCEEQSDDSLSCARDGFSRIWDVTTGREIIKFSPGSRFEFSPTSNYLISIDCEEIDEYMNCVQYGLGRVRNLTTGEQVSTFQSSTSSFVISPDDRYLFLNPCDQNDTNDSAVCLHSSIRKLETNSGRQLWKVDLEGQAYVITGLDDKYIIAVVLAKESTNVYVLSSDNGTEIHRWPMDGELSNFMFSPDLKHVVAVSDNYSLIHVLETDNGKEIARMKIAPYSGINFSPDSNYVVAQGNDNVLRIWLTNTGEEVSRLALVGPKYSIGFTGDGKDIALKYGFIRGSKYVGIIGIWEVTNGKEIVSIEVDFPGGGIAFSPDDNYVISNGHVWSIRSNDIITNACAYLPRNLTRAEWERFIGDAILPYQAVCENLPIETEGTVTPTVAP